MIFLSLTVCHSFFLFISRGNFAVFSFKLSPTSACIINIPAPPRQYARTVLHQCQLAVGCERSAECQYQCDGPLMVRPAAVLINYTWPTPMFACAGDAVTPSCSCKAPFCASAPRPCRYVEESESQSGRGGFRQFLINVRSSVPLLTAFQLTPLPLPL